MEICAYRSDRRQNSKWPFLVLIFIFFTVVAAAQNDAVKIPDEVKPFIENGMMPIPKTGWEALGRMAQLKRLYLDQNQIGNLAILLGRQFLHSLLVLGRGRPLRLLESRQQFFLGAPAILDQAHER